MKTLGVVIGRFQTPYLTDAHKALIGGVFKKHTYTLVIVGESPVLSERNPIPARFIVGAVQEAFSKSNLFVTSVKDSPEDAVWAESIKKCTKDYMKFLGCSEAVYYGGRDNNLKPLEIASWQETPWYDVKDATKEFADLADCPFSSTEERMKIIDTEPNTPQVRAGFILAQACKYPTVYGTVDVALLDSNPKYIWMGKKYKTAGYCFIGGFLDPQDNSRKDAAVRETIEEAGLENCADFRSSNDGIWHKELGDFRICDWRYSGTKDCVMTTLFLMQLGRDASPKAQDDLYALSKLELNTLINTPELVAPQHRKMFSFLTKYLEENPVKED